MFACLLPPPPQLHQRGGCLWQGRAAGARAGSVQCNHGHGGGSPERGGLFCIFTVSIIALFSLFFFIGRSPVSRQTDILHVPKECCGWDAGALSRVIRRRLWCSAWKIDRVGFLYCPSQANSPDLTAWQKEEPGELVRRMEDNGVKPSLMSLNVLIDACGRVRAKDDNADPATAVDRFGALALRDERVIDRNLLYVFLPW